EWIERQADHELRGWQDFAILYRSNNQAAAFEEALRRHKIPYRVVGGQSVFDNKEVRDLLAYLRLIRHPEDDLSLRRIINFPTRGIGTVTLSALIARAEENETSLWQTLQDGCDDGSFSERTEREVRLLIAATETAREGLEESAPEELSERILDFVEMIGLQRAIF